MDQAQKKYDITVDEKKNLTISQLDVKKDFPKYLQKDFINDILNEIVNVKEKMLCQVLWMSGIRVTEAINIKKQDIDFKNKVLTVRWLKNRKYKNRNVPIHGSLANSLYMYANHYNKDQLLFPITRQRAFQITKKYFNASPHQFRHSFAVNYLRSGGNIVNLHRILGHGNIRTTMEYLKIVPSDLAKELEQVSFI